MSSLSQILRAWIPGDLHGLSWFASHGVSQRLAYQYYQSGHLDKIGPGIYKRAEETVRWPCALRFLQEELGKPVHVASRSALELDAVVHFGAMNSSPAISLWSYEDVVVPRWFKTIDLGCAFQYRKSSLFGKAKHLKKFELLDGILVEGSCRELAILEYLDVLDLRHSFEVAQTYMETLSTLRPKVVKGLLEECRSIRTKRVFLYLSESLSHPFIRKLDLGKIDLGEGKRRIFEGGELNRKYMITVPPRSEEGSF